MVKVYSSIQTPCAVSKLESLCIQAAHAGRAQADVVINGDVIQIVIPNEGENNEHTKS